MSQSYREVSQPITKRLIIDNRPKQAIWHRIVNKATYTKKFLPDEQSSSLKDISSPRQFPEP